MGVIRKTGKFWLVLILPAIVWLIINSAVNGHYHKLQNGKIIHHCHPYKHNENNNSPFEDHHHSNAEYYIIDLISNTIVLLSSFFIFHSITFAYKYINCLIVLLIPPKEYYFSNNYRSPPDF